MAENNSSAPLKTAEGEDERALFEAVASDHGLWPKAIERDAKGNYLLLTTANGWMWWQHARSIRTAPPQAAPAAVAVPDERWCPDVCPITGREFFMWVTHHESGDDVPTYGGPFDSYTIPTQDKDGSFSCERYDHDFGGWKDWENVGLMLVDDQSFVVAPDNPRYYEIEQFATPALPATEDSSAGDLAEPAAFDATFTNRVIEALQENGDPVSVDAAEEMAKLRDMLLASPQAQPADAPIAYLQESDRHLLHRFIETTEDDESFDIGKDAVKRLANLGVVESYGFGRYGVTMFGYWVHEHYWHQNPSLPLKTNADRDREHRAAMAAAQEGGKQ